jgi:carbonic anhydrase
LLSDLYLFGTPCNSFISNISLIELTIYSMTRTSKILKYLIGFLTIQLLVPVSCSQNIDPSESVRMLQYSYTAQGYDWGGLCSSGSSQSPIEIDDIKGSCSNTMIFDITFNSTSVATILKNTGANLTANGSWANVYATDINGNLLGYSAKSFSIKSPAEHVIDGSQPDLELQIYCTSKSEFNASALNGGMDAAIVSFLFWRDDTQPADPFIASLYAASAGTNISVNIANTLGGELTSPVVYYTYQGSLSAPPCTQNVNWFVVNQRFTVTSLQLSAFNTYWSMNTTFANGNGNNRGTQGVNGRTILQGGIQCQDQFVYFFSFFILYIFINYFIFKLL